MEGLHLFLAGTYDGLNPFPIGLFLGLHDILFIGLCRTSAGVYYCHYAIFGGDEFAHQLVEAVLNNRYNGSVLNIHQSKDSDTSCHVLVTRHGARIDC
jgi:hypothetical protein